MASSLIYLMLFLPHVFAGTKLRYFRDSSCNGSELADFSNDVSKADLDCHIPPRNITRAISVDDIDTDCAIITFSDYACTPERARRTFADKDMCFFSHKGGLLRSWRTVCGQEMISLAATWETYDKTHVPSGISATAILSANGRLTTYTSIESWTTTNGTGQTVLYATVTRTGVIPVSTSVSAAVAHFGNFKAVGVLGVTMSVLFGVVAII